MTKNSVQNQGYVKVAVCAAGAAATVWVCGLARARARAKPHTKKAGVQRAQP